MIAAATFLLLLLPQRAAREARPESAVTQAASIDLPLLGSYRFGVDERPHPDVRDVEDFCIDGEGRFGWVRSTGRDPATWELAVVDQTGRLARRVDLGELRSPHGGNWPCSHRLAWLGGDRWLVVLTDSGPKPASFAWRVDVDAGTLHPLAEFAAPEIQALAALPEDGFAVLVGWAGGRLSGPAVRAYDRDGHLRWGIDWTSDASDPSKLYMPKSLAASSSGGLLVLDSAREVVQSFDASGRYRGRADVGLRDEIVPLTRAIAPDRDDGCVVLDQGTADVVRRFDREGRVSATCRPRWPDGYGVDVRQVRCDPEGRLWACTPDALLRLSDDGVVADALGDPIRPERLGRPGGVEVDVAGRLYVRDRATESIHVFDERGEALRVCVPDPSDFPRAPFWSAVTVAPDGSLYRLESDVAAPGTGSRYLEFAPDGRRLGWRELAAGGGARRWTFQPNQTASWFAAYRTLFLLGPDRIVVRTIDRQPDGQPIRRIEDVAVASDGSVAVLASLDAQSFATACTLNVYTAEGESISTFALPADVRRWQPALAWNGRWAAVAREDGSFILLEVASGELASFAPAHAAERRALRPFASAGGAELWLVDLSSRLVERHAFPKP